MKKFLPVFCVVFCFFISELGAQTLSFTVTSTLPTCPGCCNGSFTLNVSGCSSYSFAVSPFAGAPVNTSSGLVYSNLCNNNYSVMVMGGSPCNSSAVYICSLVLLPCGFNPVTVIASSNTLCAGSTATLSASGASTYSWNTGPTSSSISVMPSSNTVYTVSGSTGSCYFTNTLAIGVNANPTVTAVASSNTICGGSTLTITAAGASTYLWSNGSAAASQTVAPFTSTNYVVSGQLNGCIKTSTVYIAVHATPTVILNPSTSTLCSGSSVTITATGALYFINNNVAFISFILVSPSVTSTYSVTGIIGNCSSTTTALVVVLPAAIITTNATATSVCRSASATTLIASGANSYTWSTNSNNASIVVTPSLTSSYTVYGSSTNGCASSKTLSVLVYPGPTLTLSTTNTLVCFGEALTLKVNGAISYTWNTGANGNSIIVNPPGITTYYVAGRDSLGCITGDTITIAVQECVGFDEQNPDPLRYFIFPNPGNGVFNVRSGAFEGARYCVYDLEGRKMLDHVITMDLEQIDLTEYANGIYLLKLYGPGEKSQTKLLLKE